MTRKEAFKKFLDEYEIWLSDNSKTPYGCINLINELFNIMDNYKDKENFTTDELINWGFVLETLIDFKQLLDSKLDFLKNDPGFEYELTDMIDYLKKVLNHLFEEANVNNFFDLAEYVGIVTID